jgi:EAL domain-containing protein (putative c-di-GMP-specific phosphodiesterase class I)
MSPTFEDVEGVVRAASGLKIFLQPIVDLRFAHVAGYEALTRFDGSDATPDRWFAVAQLAGLGAELEALALTAAFDRRRELAATAFLAVNISPHLLGSSPVQAAFAAAAPLDNIVVELTEHVDAGSRGELLDALLSLRRRGARIALDDMGTGYSGLREIATLQPDVVKLDRSFVDHCDRDPVKAAVVELMCGISNRLQATLIAEGVERVQELDWLQQAGVPLAQGWLLGRPDASTQPLGAGTVAHVRSGADLSAPANRATAGAIMRWAPELSPADRPPRDGPWPHQPDDQPAQLHVLLDDARRPRALVMYGADGPVGEPFPITLRAYTGTPLTQLARQIPGRPLAHRYDPVVCTTTDGKYLGILEVDQLLRVLADQIEGQRPNLGESASDTPSDTGSDSQGLPMRDPVQ